MITDREKYLMRRAFGMCGRLEGSIDDWLALDGVEEELSLRANIHQDKQKKYEPKECDFCQH